MGASAKRANRNYRQQSVPEQSLISDDTERLLEKLNDKIYLLEENDRVEFIIGCLFAAKTDEVLSIAIKRMILRGMWFLEFKMALDRLPREVAIRKTRTPLQRAREFAVLQGR